MVRAASVGCIRSAHPTTAAATRVPDAPMPVVGAFATTNSVSPTGRSASSPSGRNEVMHSTKTVLVTVGPRSRSTSIAVRS